MKKVKSLFLLIYFFCLFQPDSWASVQLYRYKADSLFLAENYAQASQYYESLHQIYDYSTPQMLMRLAFMKEGSGDYVGALYYLNLYYLQKPEKKVLQKIQELAKKNELIGYDFTDFEYLLFLYNHYYLYVVAFLILLSVVVTVSIVRTRLQKDEMTYKPVLLILLLLFSFFLINYSNFYKRAIIYEDNTRLMNGASAAATPQYELKKGSRIAIKSKQDVWYEIVWNNEKLYVHEQNLKVIN
jgi:hypothetical protein